MRIVGGQARGRKLHPPKDRAIRPTSDRVRESLFNVLQSVNGLQVLDLFAGSGAVGLEAFSRGAQSVLFIDSSRVAMDVIRQNINVLAATDRTDCWLMDAHRALKEAARQGLRFDIVFSDPPYEGIDTVFLLDPVLWQPVLADNGRLIWESSRRNPPDIPEGWERVDHRRYGETELWFLALS